jgi:hypothetical protein
MPHTTVRPVTADMANDADVFIMLPILRGVNDSISRLISNSFKNSPPFRG